MTKSATIFENGERTRACKYVGCSVSESQAIPKTELSSILIAVYPTKLTYIAGESFDPSGIVVQAIGEDGAHINVTSYIAYNKTVLSETDTTVTASYGGKSAEILISVIGLSNHTHAYEGEWKISENATILECGEKYRECTFPACTERETETIEKIQIADIAVTAAPEKLIYIAGESFDPTGISVTATDITGEKHDVTEYVSFDKTILNEADTSVTVIFDGKNASISLTVLERNHTHTYEDAWTVDSPTTIFKEGEKHRACTFPQCTEKETQVIEKIAVTEIAVTNMPERLSYIGGERFDATGITVIAIGADGSRTDVTSLVTYDKTVLADTDTSATVSYGGKSAEIAITVHTHVFKGEWTVYTPTTIFSEGQRYRFCGIKGCTETEIETIPRVEVTEISISQSPTKTEYKKGDAFDPTGIVVIAEGADGSRTDISALVTYDKTILADTDTAVTASYGGRSAEIPVTVISVFSVSEALTRAEDGATIMIEGIFVGIADEGSGYSKELLLKDPDNDNLISIIGVTYGSFPNYGYNKGDLVRVEGTLVKEVYDSEISSSQNNTFVSFAQTNPADINETVVSRGNRISYDLDSVVEINSRASMKEYFTPDNVQAYTYIHVTGTAWFNTYFNAGDGVLLHRFSMNSSASALSGIKPDGKRAVGFRQNVIEANTPAIMSSDFAGYFGSKNYPGKKATVDFYAVINATNSVNYQLTILDAKWIKNNGMQDITVETQQDIVVEMANAYYRQGTQIHYDQTWRSTNFSPEDATAQRQLNLDRSSYVNSIYYEAFGHNILNVPITTKSPNTANYTAYAKENAGITPDAIGYWETADYTTEKEQKDLLSYVESILQVGDIIVFRRGKTSSTSGHTLIYIGNGTFLRSTGTKCTYDEENPENSVDIASTTEYTAGTIGLVKASALFTDTSSSRYLFKKTAAETVFTFCLLRPLALGLTTTEKTENRAKIPGVVMEKIVSCGLGAAVCRGESITYTLTLQNLSSNTYIGIDFEETLSDCVQFVSGHAGLTLNGQKLSMKVNLEAGDTLMISWTVKVKADAASGARIESKNTSFGGVGILATENYVSAYTDAQLADVAARAREIAAASGKYSDPIELAKAIYKDVLSVDLFACSTTEALLESVPKIRFEGYSTLMVNAESEYADMVLSDLCIGRGMSSSLPSYVRIVEEDLTVGDLIFCQWPSGYRLFIYPGNNEFVQIDTIGNVASTVNGGETGYVLTTTGSGSKRYELQNFYNSFRSYKKCVVIRPSIAQ